MKILPKVLVWAILTGWWNTTNTLEDLETLCHSENIWREARGESLAGQQLVYWVVVNRGGHPCETIWKPYQFSWTTNWNRVFLHSTATRDLVNHLKTQPNPWPHITHYHNQSVNPPWSKKLKKAFVIGNHTFYYDK